MKPIYLLGLALLPIGVLRAQTAAPIYQRVAPEKNQPATDKPATDKPAPTTDQVAAKTATGFAPLGYFDANCARCHGPNGSFYGKDFGKNLKDDAALKQIVKEMCEGPGNAPLNEKSLEILTDFHRALRDDKPFLILVSQDAKVLSGEASPDAKVTLENGAKTLNVDQKGNSWKVAIPADFSVEGAKLVARRGEKVSEIALKAS